MGLGILESSHMEHVPGTTLLDERSAHAEEHTGNLKHVPGRPDLILVPQPSDDPNDSLNWYFIHSYICLTEQASMAKRNIQLDCLYHFLDHHRDAWTNLDTRRRTPH